MVYGKKIKALFCGGYILEDGTVVTDEGTILTPAEAESREGPSAQDGPYAAGPEIDGPDEQ